MRKIMLAATAIAGLGLSGAAFAQNTSTATSPLSVGSNMFAGSPNISFTPFNDMRLDKPDAGTMNVYVNGMVGTGVEAGSDSGSSGAGNGGTKINPVGIFAFMRLYFGFDGTTASGLQYGALAEIRQFYDAQYQAGGAADATQVRRERVYIATPTAGKLLLGITDGPLGTLVTGDTSASNFDGGEGGWQADAVQTRTKGTILNYPIASQSGEYMSNKLVYQSPNFSGFEFGLSYEPNQQAGEGYCLYNTSVGNCNNASSVSATTNAALSTAGLLVNKSATVVTAIGVAGNRSNTLEAAARYSGAFGPAKFKVEVGTWQSGVVSNNTTTVNRATRGLNALDAGVSVTVGNLTVGGHYLGGQISPTDGPLPAGAKKSTFLAGEAIYTIGKVGFGAAIIDWNSNPSLAYGQLHEIGESIGAFYDFAPGAQWFFTGSYGTRHATGYNLLTGNTMGVGVTTPTGAAALHNTVQARAASTGFIFKF